MRLNAFSPLVAVLSLSLATAAHAQLSPAATNGKATFDKSCGICHNADSTDKKIGPGLKGLYTHATLADGSTPVNDATVTDRIMNGKVPMPPFKDQLTPAQVQEIVAYLKTL